MVKNVRGLTDSERTALSEIKRRVSAMFDVREYILFGSKARGDAAPDSDVDLLIVTDQTLDWRQVDRIIGEVYETNLICGTLFTAHTVAAAEWDSGVWANLSLRRNVEKEGISV